MSSQTQNRRLRVLLVIAVLFSLSSNQSISAKFGLKSLAKKAIFPSATVKIKGKEINLTPLGPVDKKTYDKALEAGSNIAKAGGRVAKASGERMAAPTVQIYNILAGEKNLGQATRSLVQGHGKEITAISEAVAETNNQLTNTAVYAAEKIAGNPGKVVLNWANGTNRYTCEFATTSMNYGGTLLKFQPPSIGIAIPVAAAIRAAEKQFLPESKPIPDAIKARLIGRYPDEILNEARWTVGNLSITAPGIVNSFNSLRGKPYAMTVGKVIVFNQEPGDDEYWWAHELGHVIQYKELGIDKFAFKWLMHHSFIESDADNKAFRALAFTGWSSPKPISIDLRNPNWQNCLVSLEPGEIAEIIPSIGAWTLASSEPNTYVSFGGYQNSSLDQKWRSEGKNPELPNSLFGVVLVKAGSTVKQVDYANRKIGPFLSKADIEFKINDASGCFGDNDGSCMVTVRKSLPVRQ